MYTVIVNDHDFYLHSCKSFPKLCTYVATLNCIYNYLLRLYVHSLKSATWILPTWN